MLYISALDNPNITLEMALRFLQRPNSLNEIKNEVLQLNKQNKFVPVINEDIESRLIQILFLTDNLPDDYSVSITNLQKAIFKMALPESRISIKADHPFERNTCIHYLNHMFDGMFDCYKGKYNDDLKIDLDPFTSEGKLAISVIAKTIAWSASPVGQSMFNR